MFTSKKTELIFQNRIPSQKMASKISNSGMWLKVDDDYKKGVNTTKNDAL